MRDPIPTDPHPNREHLIVTFLFQSRWAMIDMFPDITELSIEDDEGVEWFRVRLRPDTK